MSGDMVLSRASVDVEIALDQVRRDLASVKSMVNKTTAATGTEAGRTLGSRMSSGFKSALSSIGRVAATTSKYAAVGIAAIGVAAVKTGLETASGMEQAQIGFTTMLGSARKARRFLGELEDFSASTPFEFPDLVSASQRMLAMGFSAKEVRPTLTAVGDAVAGLGGGAAEIERVTTALGQIQAKGKASSEEMMQLTEAGIPAWDMLAKKMGVSVPQAMEKVTDGAVNADVAIGALVTGMNRKFGGLMENQSKTVAGRFSTLKDTVTMGLADVVKPWMPAIKKGLADLTGQAGPFLADLAAKSKELAKDAPRAMELVRAKVAQVKELLSGGVGADTAGAWEKLRTAAADLGPALADAAAELPNVADLMSVSAVAISFLADHTDTLAKALPYLAMGLVAYKVAQLAANVAAAVSVPMKIAEVAVNWQLVKSNKALVATRAQLTTGTAAATVAETAGTTAKTRSGIVTAALAVKERALAAARKAGAIAQRVLNLAMKANPIGLVITAIGLLVGAMVLAYKKSETFRRIVDGAWSMIKTATSAVFGFIAAFVSSAIDKAKAAIDALGSVPGRVRAFFGAAKDAAVSKLTALLTWVRGLPGRILTALGNLGSTLMSAGGDLVGGLMSGIRARAGELISTVKAYITDRLPGFVKKALGIASPSKVFAGIGRDTVAGLVQGIAKDTDRVEGAMERLSDRLVAAFDKKKTKEKAKAAAAEVMRGFTDETRALKQAIRARQAAAEDLKKAKEKLEEKREELREFAGGITGSARDFASVVGDTGDEGPADAAAIIADMRARADAVKQYRTQLEGLRGAGLNETTYRDLLDKGVQSGGATVAALAAGGSAVVAQINAIQADVDRESRLLGNHAAQDLYGAGVAAQEGLVAGLTKDTRELERAAQRLARVLERAIRKALGIKSPSTVTARLGAYAGQGFEEGLLHQLRAIQRASDRVALAAVPRMSMTAPRFNTTAVGHLSPSAIRVAAGAGDGRAVPEVKQVFPASVDPMAAAAAAGDRVVTALSAWGL